MTVHIGEIRRAGEQMRDTTTTRTGLVLPPVVAETLTGWLEEIAASEHDYYTTNRPTEVEEPQPLDAAHGAWTISRAWLAATTADAEAGHARNAGIDDTAASRRGRPAPILWQA